MRFLPRPAPACLFVALLAVPSAAADVPADWAFKPVLRPAAPRTAPHPVDAFLLARLHEKGLSFAPEADRRTLIRRVYFDLIGLPPTPEAVEAFVNDTSADAYEKVVDRLLASPQYGERMALMWLDLVRFAESDGFKADDARPNAWRYRDYVIQSFNADKPYDRFVREQLAGDELFPDDPAALVATGFLRHFPYEYNAVDVELKRQDMLNDITDTTGAVFLGLTVGCAKCHDHKTDPIPQADYYRLQAFFAGFWPADVPVAAPGERATFEQRKAEWEARTADLRKQMDELEQPVREKAMARERQRFQPEHLKLVDMPADQRTPLQRQLALLVERQISGKARITATQMPAAVRTQWEGMAKQMAELEKDRPAELPKAMAMTDLGPTPPPTHLLKRGNWKNRGEELAPGFLTAIDGRDAEVTPRAKTTGRRTALANWVADPKNPLTARVMVNRLWQQHFGTGIVASPSDLGDTGDRPTHPELLDWLASEFVTPASGTRQGAVHGSQQPADAGRSPQPWSVKHLHRLIVTSAAYKQSARGSDAAVRADPDNKLLSRYPRRRLDGETLRDAVLAVSGQLNPKAGGPSVFPELPAEIKSGAWKVSADPAERNRRSVYVFVKRNLRYPFFSLFDSPDRTETCGRRFVTTTAPQALTLLNDALVLNHAKSFAARVQKDAGPDAGKQVTRAFALAFGRPPAAEELAAARSFLAAHTGAPAEALTDLCHALLNLNEFLYVD